MNNLIGAVITDIGIEDNILFSITVEKDNIKSSITGGFDVDGECCLETWEKTK